MDTPTTTTNPELKHQDKVEFHYNGQFVTGTVIEVTETGYLVRISVRLSRGRKSSKEVWLAKNLGQTPYDPVVYTLSDVETRSKLTKGKVLGFLGAFLGVASVFAMFNPQAAIVVKVLEALLSAFGG